MRDEFNFVYWDLQLKNEVEYSRGKYNAIANEYITVDRVKCWFVKCMFQLHTHVCMNVLNDYAKCILTEDMIRKM